MSETVLQITDEALVKWVKQYAAAREESLGAIVTEALGEYRERILALVKPKEAAPFYTVPVVHEELIGGEDSWASTVSQSLVEPRPEPKPIVPPMVPSPEELF